MIELTYAKDNPENLKRILNRNQFEFDAVNDAVDEILKTVKQDKDQALFAYTKRFDNVDISTLKVNAKDIDAAFKRIDPALLNALKTAAKNIELFHEKQRPKDFTIDEKGAVVGQRFSAIERVGLYIPGGTAAYPSTVLMNALPAKIAGVKKIVMVSPPQPDGTLKDSLLVAARLSGVEEIYMIGGAQAIAALTFGTESVPKVDKIVGPGNIYVAIAKRMVAGYVGIDMIAGPSEITIVADKSANPAYIASDMLSQAEHDEYASAIVLIDDEQVALKVKEALISQTRTQPRAKMIEQSLRNFGGIIVTENIEQSIELANRIAPEHCEVMTANAEVVAGKINNAGALFIGSYSPEPLGDYLAGPNHTLPTSATARFSSALSTTDFMKATSIINYSKQAFMDAAKDTITIAEEEGLYAHAKAIKIRMKDGERS